VYTAVRISDAAAIHFIQKAAILGLSFTKLLPNAQPYSSIHFTAMTEKFLISCALISINQFIRQ